MPSTEYLIVSASEKAGRALSEILGGEAALCVSIDAARQYLETNTPDCCILNAPTNGDACGFAAELAESTQAQILLLAPEDKIALWKEPLAPHGILLLAKPVGRQVLTSALSLMHAVQVRMTALQNANLRLSQKLNEQKVVDRAKCVLISALGMSEPQAHRHMERQAMDLRQSKYEIALNVLKVYENR